MEITVRSAEPGDLEAIRRVYGGPRAVWGTFQLPFSTAERWRRLLSEPEPGAYDIVACAGGDVVGHLGLRVAHQPRRAHTAALGMAVRDDWQGKGAGTALMQAAVDLADKWLNLQRLELQVYTDNEPAVRLYKRFGFVVEGTHVAFAFRDGKLVDAYAMARLRLAPAP
ncbi:MAG: GNAT family N-acetyltransferase [Planctomycetes bacterium]|nr:GNAT family N-acetyltransferase [Planctomycetota bacterium]